ncbi:MAG: DUF2851 family protein [Opitutaceae bacterium]|jgi:hypothetical protein
MLLLDPQIRPEDQEGHVAEIQGADGPYSFSELILQKIWMRREFDCAAAMTMDGRPLMVQHPGRWNRCAGPDFRCARLRLGTCDIAGDIEVHVNAADWDVHGHAADPEYDRVVLHVVLFPPPPGHRTLGFDGREIPVLSLLSLLPRDAESFALDDAAEHLAGRPAMRLFDSLRSMPSGCIRDTLCGHAFRRWNEKVRFARIRIERLGWGNACHHAALECMGYSGNRAPMLKIAGRWALGDWSSGGVSARDVWTAMQDCWRVRCGRPANHPLHRLRQYSDWVEAVPDWPERLASFTFHAPALPVSTSTREARRASGMPAMRRRLASEILAFRIGGTRFDTLVCDAFLPLLAARHSAALAGYWHHWYLGDAPDSVRAALCDAVGVDSRLFSNCNGLAQGILAWYNAQIMGRLTDREPGAGS